MSHMGKLTQRHKERQDTREKFVLIRECTEKTHAKSQSHQREIVQFVASFRKRISLLNWFCLFTSITEGQSGQGAPLFTLPINARPHLICFIR